jgi:hypothetical protein
MTNHDNTAALTPKTLREFGLLTGALIIVLVGGLLPWLWERDILEWQKITAPVGGTLILWALAHPASLAYVYKPWMYLAEKIGWFNTRVIMALLFYVVIFPIGAIMRLAGKDPMARKFETAAASYRKLKAPQPKDHMETPF